jgi:hypothetical protein
VKKRKARTRGAGARVDRGTALIIMLRLVLGLLKGGVIGGALGYAAYSLGLGAGWGWLVYGAVGSLVGFFVGRPFWSHLFDKKSTVWTSILKAMFGFGVGVGLWALGAKVAGDPKLALAGETHSLTQWQPIFGAIVGVLYGAWVEVDDPPVKKDKPAEKAAKR